jgi:peroxiredoxin (alkyl hydroperoxide reductase subunit C)
MAGALLLADGFHFHLSDRDRQFPGGSATSPIATQVLGLSTDALRPSRGGRTTRIRDLRSMLADTKRELAEALGILHKQDGVALRATFIVDPEGVIRWVSVNDLSVGRSVPEVLRVLDALQTDELCPCNWQKGQPTLQVA